MYMFCMLYVLSFFWKLIFRKLNKHWYYWCPHTDSNREPTDYKSVALPIELWKIFNIAYIEISEKKIGKKIFFSDIN